VPSQAVEAHKALAQSYIQAGTRLSAIADAKSDADFLKAIEAYNAAADTLANRYIDLTVIFSLSGVTFSQDDPGSIFMFSGGGTF
jgi:hypothetical protein